MGQCVRFCIIPGTIVLVMGGVSVDAREVEVNSYFTQPLKDKACVGGVLNVFGFKAAYF